MTTWWRASVLAAAGAAVLLAGCGIRVAEEPLPAPARTATHPVAEASPAPAATPSAGASLEPLTPAAPAGSPSASPSDPLDETALPSPLPSASPLQTTPTPATPREKALAAAARRVRAATAVRAAVPAFDQLAAGMVARSGVPGAAVAVVAGDTVMYSRCFGLRQMGAADAVDDDTLFQIGGVSRAYTTTLLASLAGDGELAWDQPVRRVWPGFRLRDGWATRAATFRDLTAARSGLPAYAGTELRAFGYSRAEILRRLRYLRPAAGFRAVWAPQDALVVAAAAAAERATGQSWAQLMLTRVLRPARADGTTLGYRAFVRAVDTATPHRLVDGTMVPQDPADEDVFAPALGVGSSLTDLVAFARLQLNGGALAGARVAPAGLLGQTLRPPRRRSPTLRTVRWPPVWAGSSPASTAGSWRRPPAVSPAGRAPSSRCSPTTAWQCRARQRVPAGPRPGAGAGTHTHGLRRAGGAAGRLARRRAGRPRGGGSGAGGRRRLARGRRGRRAAGPDAAAGPAGRRGAAAEPGASISASTKTGTTDASP